MEYIVLTVFSAIFLGLYDLFKKISIEKGKNIYEILFIFSVVSFVLSFIFINKAFNINFSHIIFVFIKTLVISLSWFLTAKAFSNLDVGIVVPFSLLGTITTTILAWMFFKESIGIVQIGGISIILLGLILLSKLCEKNEKNNYKYLFLLALAAFLSSVSAIIDKYLLNSIDKGVILFWFFMFLSLIYLIVSFIKNKKIDFKSLTSNLWIAGISVSIFISDLLYYQAISYENVSISVVSIVRKLSVFIGVVLGCVFLKEKYLIKKILILFFMFLGLGVILFV